MTEKMMVGEAFARLRQEGDIKGRPGYPPPVDGAKFFFNGDRDAPTDRTIPPGTSFGDALAYGRSGQRAMMNEKGQLEVNSMPPCWGMPVVLDENVPDDEIHIRDSAGSTETIIKVEDDPVSPEDLIVAVASWKLGLKPPLWISEKVRVPGGKIGINMPKDLQPTVKGMVQAAIQVARNDDDYLTQLGYIDVFLTEALGMIDEVNAHNERANELNNLQREEFASKTQEIAILGDLKKMNDAQLGRIIDLKEEADILQRRVYDAVVDVKAARNEATIERNTASRRLGIISAHARRTIRAREKLAELGTELGGIGPFTGISNQQALTRLAEIDDILSKKVA